MIIIIIEERDNSLANKKKKLKKMENKIKKKMKNYEPDKLISTAFQICRDRQSVQSADDKIFIICL